MSKKMEDATQKAFAAGQEAWRQSEHNNPYPIVALDYHAAWQDGWDEEEATQQK